MKRRQLPNIETKQLSFSLAKDIITQFSQSLRSEDGVALYILHHLAKEINAVCDELLTTEQAAQMLGLTTAALKQRCKTIKGVPPEIPFHDFHGKKFFSKQELTEYLLQRRLYK
ncbi:MAG: helix-turn-helix domain-containing protein [Bacteroidaceae bacterium]|nr:helix-turn-helix domain-containing protein [Bacteroidaceae bacterium]MBR7028848.1 helix-turn-helix domain-containing protein [Bacteroidaceae bacterium]